jgi:type III secretion system HrpB2-like protein
MITPIDSVVPVSPVVEAAKKAVDSPAMDQLSEKFGKMMESGGDDFAPSQFHAANEPTGITQLMDKEDQMIKQSSAELDALGEAAPTMSNNEFAAASMRVSETLLQTQFHITVASSVSSGVSQSLRSLLRNQ